MKKTLMIAAVAALSLASCQNDEVVDVQKTEIKFSVFTENASRGEVSDAFMVGTEGFKLWGYIQGEATPHVAVADPDNDEAYFGETVSGALRTFTDCAPANKYYFPSGKTMDFYAIYSPNMWYGNNWSSGWANTLSWSGATIPETYTEGAKGWGPWMQDAGYANPHQDLVFAVTKNVTEEQAKAGRIPLNFRHAKSQIVFNAGIDNGTRLEVHIQSVKIKNVVVAGAFKFPDVDTRTPNYSGGEYVNGEEPTADADHAYKASWGEWCCEVMDGMQEIQDVAVIHNLGVSTDDEGSDIFTYGDPLVIRGIQIGDDPVTEGLYAIGGRNVENSIYHDKEGTMFLIPQGGMDTEGEPIEYEFEVTCAMYSVNANNERVKVFPSSADTAEGTTYGTISKNVAVNWLAGKKYVYNLNFSDSGATEIKFSITVDEYQIGDTDTIVVQPEL